MIPLPARRATRRADAGRAGPLVVDGGVGHHQNGRESRGARSHESLPVFPAEVATNTPELASRVTAAVSVAEGACA